MTLKNVDKPETLPLKGYKFLQKLSLTQRLIEVYRTLRE